MPQTSANVPPGRNRLRSARLPLLALVALLLCACAGRASTTAATTEPSQARSAQAQSLRAGGVDLDYLDLAPQAPVQAKGRPLLLITGYAVTKEMWDQRLVQELAAHRRVILLDNRGMGPSPAPAAPFTIADMARDAAALLDALGIERADVLGWSMGGMTAQELALARPELVASLVLYATAPDSAELMPVLDRMAALPPPQLQAAMFPPAWAKAHPQALATLPARLRAPDMSIISRQYAAMRAWGGTQGRLARLAMPVLLLAGGQDWVCPAEQSRRMAEAIPGARLVVLPQGGHWLMHQQPEELARQVEDFLCTGARR